MVYKETECTYFRTNGIFLSNWRTMISLPVMNLTPDAYKVSNWASFLNCIIYSDECALHLDGKVKEQNVRNWGGEILHEQKEIARNRAKITV